MEDLAGELGLEAIDPLITHLEGVLGELVAAVCRRRWWTTCGGRWNGSSGMFSLNSLRPNIGPITNNYQVCRSDELRTVWCRD